MKNNRKFLGLLFAATFLFNSIKPIPLPDDQKAFFTYALMCSNILADYLPEPDKSKLKVRNEDFGKFIFSEEQQEIQIINHELEKFFKAFARSFFNNVYIKNSALNRARAEQLVTGEGAELFLVPSLSLGISLLLSQLKETNEGKSFDPENRIENALMVVAKAKKHTIDEVLDALNFLGNNLSIEKIMNFIKTITTQA